MYFEQKSQPKRLAFFVVDANTAVLRGGTFNKRRWHLFLLEMWASAQMALTLNNSRCPRASY